MKEWQKRLLARFIRGYDRIEDAFTINQLFQINATLIAGALIFLTISFTLSNPSANLQLPQLDAEGFPMELRIMILEYNLQASEELKKSIAETSSAEALLRTTIAATVIIPIVLSSILSVLGMRFQAVVALLVGMVLLMTAIILVLYLSSSLRSLASSDNQIGSKDLENKHQAIKEYIAALRTNGTATQ